MVDLRLCSSCLGIQGFGCLGIHWTLKVASDMDLKWQGLSIPHFLVAPSLTANTQISYIVPDWENQLIYEVANLRYVGVIWFIFYVLHFLSIRYA